MRSINLISCVQCNNRLKAEQGILRDDQVKQSIEIIIFQITMYMRVKYIKIQDRCNSNTICEFQPYEYNGNSSLICFDLGSERSILAPVPCEVVSSSVGSPYCSVDSALTPADKMLMLDYH